MCVNGSGKPHTTDTNTIIRVSTEGWGEALLDPTATFLRPGQQGRYYGPEVTTNHTVSVLLRHGIRVDISVDRALRVVNFDKECTAAIGGDGDCSCACHACGRVLQQGVTVDLTTGSKMAKISGRGVIFTAHNH